MFLKGYKLYSIIRGRCPKCHEEPMFKNANPYALHDAFSMHERCKNCNTKYKMEPSFFYGSMYVSYGLSIGFAVAAFLISFIYLDTSLSQSIWIIVATLIVFMPIILRLSRTIWINMFIGYDPKSASQKDAKIG